MSAHAQFKVLKEVEFFKLKYSESWRNFHNWNRIISGLRLMNTFFKNETCLYDKADELVFAWFMLDYVCVPGCAVCREASAEVVDTVAQKLHLDLNTDLAIQLIRAVDLHRPISGTNQHLSEILIDIDLSYLVFDFEESIKAMTKEFRVRPAVTTETALQLKADWLYSFLKLNTLFFTTQGRKWETRVRASITAELQSLGQEFEHGSVL